MSISQRIIELIDYLIDANLVSSSKEFGELIGENPNGVSDLKSERKKFTIEHLINVKNNLPYVNLYWILEGKGDIITKGQNEDYVNLKEELQELKKENNRLKKLIDLALDKNEYYEKIISKL